MPDDDLNFLSHTLFAAQVMAEGHASPAFQAELLADLRRAGEIVLSEELRRDAAALAAGATPAP